MSMDRSLKVRSALARHRNVLSRDERLEVLSDQGAWNEETNSVFGLPKVAHRKSIAGKKVKKAKETETAGVPATEAASTSEQKPA